MAKQHSVTVGALLLKARECAQARGLEEPPTIDDVTDEQLVFDVVDWLGPA